MNMNSTGTLDAQTGTVSITGGGSGNGVFQAGAGATSQFNGNYTANSGAQFIGAGTNLLVGGTFTLNGTISSSNAVLAGATLAGTNGVITGILTWTSGTIPVGSTLTIATNGMLIWAGTADSYSFYGALTNAGTVLLTNGDWKWWSCYANPVQFINLPGALLDIKADVSVVDSCGGGLLVNYGTVRKSGGTGTSTINVTFNNTGMLDAQSGMVSLSGSYNLTNGTLNFGIGNLTSFGKINLSGSPAALAGAVSANLNNGYLPASGNSFSVLTYSSRSGTFTNFNLPFAVAWQTNYGSTAFTLTVLNVRPTLAAIPDQTVNELTTLTVTNSASDPDADQTLTFALVSAPSGMTIASSAGTISWTPQQTNSPSTNTVLVSVTDNGTPPLSVTNSFIVVVREVNVPPSLPTISTQFVNALTLLTVTNTATNANIHATITGYTLVNPPSNMAINASGIITWTPSQAQSPSTNVITTIVTNMDSFDFVNPQLTSTNSFTVVVKAVNVAAHYIRRAGQTLTTDIPGASVSGGPSYWQIFLPFSMQTSGNQIFFARPDSQTEANGVGAASSSTLQWFTTIPVSTLPGLNSPPASIVSASSDVIWTNGVIDEATGQFVSIELVDFTPYIQGVTQKNGSFTFSWNALAGQSYQAEYKTNIVQTNWTDFGSPITATNGTMAASDLMTNLQRFYRVTLLH